MLNIGHRGAAGIEPENTLRSFKRAVEIGCDMIELDVHVTSDGQIVVIHDDTVDRTTNGSGRIGALDTDQIRVLDAGLGEKILYLDEVLDVFAGRTALNIELKGSRTALPVANILETFTNGGSWRKEDLLVSSFSPIELVEFSQQDPGIRTGVLIDGNPGGSEEFASEIGAFSVHPNFSFLDRSFVEICHERDLKVHTWTVNDPLQMDEAISMGADGIITDRPDLLSEKIKNLVNGDPS